MIGNYKVELLIWIGNFMAVKSPERKAGILCADFSLSIAQHSPGNIRKSDGNRIGNPGETFFPQGTASTSDFQNVHIFSDFTLAQTARETIPVCFWNKGCEDEFWQKYCWNFDTGFSYFFPY